MVDVKSIKINAIGNPSGTERNCFSNGTGVEFSIGGGWSRNSPVVVKFSFIMMSSLCMPIRLGAGSIVPTGIRSLSTSARQLPEFNEALKLVEAKKWQQAGVLIQRCELGSKQAMVYFAMQLLSLSLGHDVFSPARMVTETALCDMLAGIAQW